MTMWIMIMWASIAVIITSLFYVSARVPNFLDMFDMAEWEKFKQFSLGLLVTLGVTGILAFFIDFINALICVLYLAMILAVSEVVFWVLQKISGITFEHYYAGWIALLITVIALISGWYFDHKVWQTDYEITTNKKVPNIKIAMFADSHIGTTFNGEGFVKHLQKIQAQNPDLAVVVGDYVDDGTKKEDMIIATSALGKLKTKYGVYFVLGNHDKGYYGSAHRGFSEADLINELEKNGIKVLRDEIAMPGEEFYIIGRYDYSAIKEQKGYRKPIEELTEGLDKNKYMLVLDHQPVEYDKDAKAEVDLVLSGHTHGGQLFPFNQVGKWIKANDLVYGHEKRQNTDFIVTSGISDWAIKFKTGTKSEYVIINLKTNENTEQK